MSDTNQGETNNSGTSTVSSDPGTSSVQQSKMGVETKLSSSSREMRNMAEKMRRDKLNNYVAEIADIVPLGSGANKRIDKTSVLRLAANYIRMHKILKQDDDESSKVPLNLGVEMTHSLAEAVGGFLLVVTSSGKVVYITEAVNLSFGHTQVDLLGHSIFNVIHPDDHDIFQKQLLPKDNCRRSFFCRMMEKALSRNDPGRYEIIHVVGQLRPLPQDHQTSSSSPSCSIASPLLLSPGEANISSDHDDEESSDNDGEMQPLKIVNRTGTHMLVSFVRVVKDRPITELSLVESTREEYITRHGMDGKILYTDHRISFVTGLMPSEVVGTSAFNYMHQDDILWSIVAQKLMFTSNQGQGTISYRLKCKDGAHVTLRSRGFLEVNKQTEQVESFVCINTVLSIKEATSEIKNQRRKLLPVITCSDTEEHLGSISSSLPPELLIVMKQLMNPEMLQKIIASVKRSDLLPEAQISEVNEGLPVDTGSSLAPIQDMEADVVKGADHDHLDCSFQTKPKRFCSEVPTCHSDPQSSVAHFDTSKDKWHRVTMKRPSVDSFSSDASKKFSFNSELPCPDLLHPNYRVNKSSKSFIPRTPSPQANISPTTSSVHENSQNYSSGTCQQYSSDNYSSASCSHSHSVNSSVVHPNISPPYQKTNTLSPERYWKQETQPSLPMQSNYRQSDMTFDNPTISQNLQSPTGYRQQAAAENVPSPNCNPRKDESTLSPSLGGLKISSSENPYPVCQQRIGESFRSPDNNSLDERGALSSLPSGSEIQNPCNAIPSHCPQSPGIGMCNQSTSLEMSFPSTFSQNMCRGLTSARNKHNNEIKPNPSTQVCDQRRNRNISSNKASSESISQYDVSSPESPSSLSVQNQFFPEYQQQASPCTPYTAMQSEHHFNTSPRDQSFTQSPQASTSGTGPGHYSQHSPLLTDQESGSQYAPISTSNIIQFCEAGAPGTPSVPEPIISEQRSSFEDPVSKDTGNVFSNGHFQHYPTHNHQGGKLL